MNSKYIAPFILRQYAWQLIKANTDLDESDYDADGDGGLVPIVPLAEEPELTQFDKPYIIYGYAEGTTNTNLPAKKRGNMVFVIYSTNFGTLTQITNILARTFERGDDSAKDVNEFSSTIPAFIGLRFGNIELSFVEGGSPEETEGGRQSAAVNIRYEYYVDYDIATSFAVFDGNQQKFVKRT